MPQHKTRQLANFVKKAQFENLEAEHVDRLKQSLLDTLGAAIAAFEAPTLRALRVHIKDFNSNGPCTLIGGVRCAPDMATLHNSGLVGFLDMNDAYVGARGTSFPSDTIPALLAAFEYRGGEGRDLLTAMALAYTTQIGLIDALESPMGNDLPYTQMALATAVGVSRALDTDVERMVNAFNIAASVGSCPNPIACGNLSEWVHMIRPTAVRQGVEAAFLGMRGMGGVSHELEGEDRTPDLLKRYDGLLDKVKDFSRLQRVSTRKYAADAHAQSAIEAAIHSRHLYDINPERITRVELETFGVAYEHLAGGNGNDCVDIVCREEASHSLPFLLAAALLDGKIEGHQFRHRYIRCQEMQRLRDAITIRHNAELDASYPDQMCQRLTLTLDDGTTHTIKKCDYLGHHTRPMTWKDVEAKFHKNAESFANDQLRAEIVDVVTNMERRSVDDLMRCLARVAPV